MGKEANRARKLGSFFFSCWLGDYFSFLRLVFALLTQTNGGKSRRVVGPLNDDHTTQSEKKEWKERPGGNISQTPHF